MSIRPGERLVHDPSAVLVYVFNWTDWLGSAEIASSTFVVDDTEAVTVDFDGILSGNKKTQARVTVNDPTAYLGRTVALTNRVETNETPAQRDDRTLFLKIQQQ